MIWNTWAEYKAYVKRCMAFTIEVYAKRIMAGTETIDGFPLVLKELIQEEIIRRMKAEEEAEKAAAAETHTDTVATSPHA